MATKKKPSVKKTKTPKPAKPKKVTLLSTELDPLREAESILTDVEKAEAECERRALRVEVAKEEYTSCRVAYKDAVAELRKLCRARKEQHPLFAKPAEKPAAEVTITKETVAAMAGQLPTVTICKGTETHGIAEGAVCEIAEVKPGGLIVSGPGINPTAIADDEYSVVESVAKLIDDARKSGISGPEAWREFLATDKPAPPANDGWKALPLDAAKINGRGGKLLIEAGYETLGAVAKLMHDHGQWWPKEVKGIGEETAAEIADRFAAFWSAHPEYCGSQA